MDGRWPPPHRSPDGHWPARRRWKRAALRRCCPGWRCRPRRPSGNWWFWRRLPRRPARRAALQIRCRRPSPEPRRGGYRFGNHPPGDAGNGRFPTVMPVPGRVTVPTPSPPTMRTPPVGLAASRATAAQISAPWVTSGSSPPSLTTEQVTASPAADHWQRATGKVASCPNGKWMVTADTGRPLSRARVRRFGGGGGRRSRWCSRYAAPAV